MRRKWLCVTLNFEGSLFDVLSGVSLDTGSYVIKPILLLGTSYKVLCCKSVITT